MSVICTVQIVLCVAVCAVQKMLTHHQMGSLWSLILKSCSGKLSHPSIKWLTAPAPESLLLCSSSALTHSLSSNSCSSCLYMSLMFLSCCFELNLDWGAPLGPSAGNLLITLASDNGMLIMEGQHCCVVHYNSLLIVIEIMYAPAGRGGN